MTRWAVVVVALVVATLAVAPARPQSVPSVLGERTFVLVMEGTRFNLATYPDTPLLEAYAGERLHFAVAVPPLVAEPHVFHLHGHPWEDASQGRFIDAKFLAPGDVHTFDVTAGSPGAHAGDWPYHCHMDDHFARGMWGILRVYPFALHVSAAGDALEVRAHALGQPLRGVRFAATLDGATVDVTVTAQREPGSYLVRPAGWPAPGTLVLTARHALGSTVARSSLDDEGSLRMLRDVAAPAAPGPVADETGALAPLQAAGKALPPAPDGSAWLTGGSVPGRFSSWPEPRS